MIPKTPIAKDHKAYISVRCSHPTESNIPIYLTSGNPDTHTPRVSRARTSARTHGGDEEKDTRQRDSRDALSPHFSRRPAIFLSPADASSAREKKSGPSSLIQLRPRGLQPRDEISQALLISLLHTRQCPASAAQKHRRSSRGIYYKRRPRHRSMYCMGCSAVRRIAKPRPDRERESYGLRSEG